MHELYAISKGRVNHIFKDLSHSFYDVLAVLACVDNPAYGLFKMLACSLGLVVTSLAVKVEHLFDHSQDLDQKGSLGVSASSPD